MVMYLARLLDIPINNATITRDWKKAIVVPIHEEGDPSVVKNYRPVTFNLSGMQTNGTRYSRLYTTSMGR